MSNIPPELISDIFSLLPVKSLLRFRCLSKSFKALIDSPKFIQSHLNHQSLKPNTDMNLILKSHNLFSLDFTSICNKDSTQQPKELQHPLKHLNGPTHVLGSCRGLLLISNNFNDNGVWNLYTKMFRKLPVCDINPPRRTPCGQGPGLAQICGGFGYDDSTDDYKAVRIAQWYHPDDEPSLVSATMVYSLKLGVWKNVQDCPYWLIKEDNGTFVGGALNWIATEEPLVRGSPVILVGLNLVSERFEEVSFPENLGEPLKLNLAELGECICLVLGYVTNARNQLLDHVDVWVMEEYGVKESWVKLFSVEQLEGRQHFSYLRPIAYSVSTGRNEVLLEMDNKKFLWYNLEKKALRHARISGGFDYFESFVSLGSLVPLYGNGYEKIELKSN